MSKNTTFWQHRETGTLRHLEQLDALCGISRALSARAERRDALRRVLDLLDRELGLNRGTITLLAPDGKEVRIEAVHDLSQQKSRSITYRIGEGVTGQVMEPGRAAIVARVSREPLFLNRFERWNVTKQELSFICVPIAIGDEVIGTISVDRPFDENAKLDEEVRILSIVAGMIAGDMRARRDAATERQELADENLRLRRELGEKFRREGIAGSSFKDMVHLFERDLIVDALKRSNGNLAATARYLKATPRIIRHRVKELGIDYKRYSGKRG
jgi:Nif-specific regulatory protein